MSLDHQMRVVLGKLEALSHGSCQAWNSSGGHSGEPDDKIITMVLRREDPPHVYWRFVYSLEKTDDGKARVIKDAHDEWKRWTGQGNQAHLRASTVSDDDLIIEQGEGFPPEVVSQRFKRSPRLIRALRARRGRDMESGRPMPGKTVVDASPERARELLAAGQSTRQVAASLGVHQKQVMRWIGRKAA